MNKYKLILFAIILILSIAGVYFVYSQQNILNNATFYSRINHKFVSEKINISTKEVEIKISSFLRSGEPKIFNNQKFKNLTIPAKLIIYTGSSGGPINNQIFEKDVMITNSNQFFVLSKGELATIENLLREGNLYWVHVEIKKPSGEEIEGSSDSGYIPLQAIFE